jgi:hypothetical protein
MQLRWFHIRGMCVARVGTDVLRRSSSYSGGGWCMKRFETYQQSSVSPSRLLLGLLAVAGSPSIRPVAKAETSEPAQLLGNPFTCNWGLLA